MKTNAILQVGGTALMIAVAACHSSSSPAQFPERIFHSSWSMDAKDLERFVVNVNAVSMGDSMEHVIAVLGTPDLDQTIKKNEKLRFFYYYVLVHRAHSPIESDKRVMIAFNSDNKVKAISSNVEGIPSKNMP
jgi:outer membrane protein assembly factor BamE (lipoprotein component of BamABCDE complex)